MRERVAESARRPADFYRTGSAMVGESRAMTVTSLAMGSLATWMGLRILVFHEVLYKRDRAVSTSAGDAVMGFFISFLGLTMLTCAYGAWSAQMRRRREAQRDWSQQEGQ